MKTIKVKFTGFWPSFCPENNFIINSLKKYFDVELVDNPEYLFSSCFSDEYLKYDCVRIFYTGENLCPDFNVFDYGIAFEYMELGDRYCRFPYYMIEEMYGEEAELMLSKHISCMEEGFLQRKEAFCSFVVSKGQDYVDDIREEAFYALSQYKKVNSGGRFLNNIGLPRGVENKLEFQKKHKFAIAFENVSHLGYSTEKIVQAFAAETVPIYWGDPEIGRQFRDEAFVNCHRFDSLEEVIQCVKEIDQDDELYMKMLKTPALKDGETLKRGRENLENFLFHICSQDYEKAFRRDRVGYGKMYCDGLLQRKLMQERNIRWKIARKIRRWKRIAERKKLSERKNRV